MQGSKQTKATRASLARAHARLFMYYSQGFEITVQYCGIGCAVASSHHFRLVYSTTGRGRIVRNIHLPWRTIRHSETLSCAMFLHPTKGCAGRLVTGVPVTGTSALFATCEISLHVRDWYVKVSVKDLSSAS